MEFWMNLPNDLRLLIGQYLSPIQVGRMSCTNKHTYALFNDLRYIRLLACAKQRRMSSLDLATKHGLNTYIQRIIQDDPIFAQFITRITMIASRYGQLDTLIWVKSQYNIKDAMKVDNNMKVYCRFTTLGQAILNNQHQVIDWLRDQGYAFNTSHLALAAEVNNVQLLTKLITQFTSQPDVISLILQGAANGGQIKLIQQYMNQDIDVACRIAMITNASSNDHSNVLDYLWDHKYWVDNESISVAVYWGHINVVKWFVAHGFQLTNELLYTAITKVHVDLAEYLITQLGSLLPNDRLCRAVYYLDSAEGIQMLKCLYRHGYRFIGRHLRWAFTRRTTLVLEYFISIGIQPTVKKIQGLIRKGKLDIIQLLYRYGVKLPNV